MPYQSKPGWNTLSTTLPALFTSTGVPRHLSLLSLEGQSALHTQCDLQTSQGGDHNFRQAAAVTVIVAKPGQATGNT